MAAKEAKDRININKLLEESGWRFFDGKGGKANVVLEPNLKLINESVEAARAMPNWLLIPVELAVAGLHPQNKIWA